MNKTVVNKSGGIGFLGALTILFIALKLFGVIQWGWLWVLAPLWFPTALVFVLLTLIVVATGWNEHRKDKKRGKK